PEPGLREVTQDQFLIAGAGRTSVFTECDLAGNLQGSVPSPPVSSSTPQAASSVCQPAGRRACLGRRGLVASIGFVSVSAEAPSAREPDDPRSPAATPRAGSGPKGNKGPKGPNARPARPLVVTGGI